MGRIVGPTRRDGTHRRQKDSWPRRPAGKNFTAEKRAEAKAKYVEVLARTGIHSAACAAIFVSRCTPRSWAANDPEFAQAIKDAEEAADDEIESALRDRSINGVKRSIFYQGAVCGEETNYSDTGAMFLLKARRYREERIEMTSPDGSMTPMGGAPPSLTINFVTPKKD